MSSAYNVLCLSHDPAITAAYDCGSPEKAVEAIAHGIDGHEHCDLLIGRNSASLVEVGCPPSLHPRRDQHRCMTHGNTEWIDITWLRLLARAYQSSDEAVRTATTEQGFRCWSRERLRRLQGELHIVLDEPAAGTPNA